MIRALTILAAVVALVVSAAQGAVLYNGHAGMALDDCGPHMLFATAKGRGAGKVASAGLAPDFGLYLSLRKAPPKPPSGTNWVSIGGGKDRGWFHGTGGDGEKFVHTSNAKFIPRDGQFRG
jgi:hypothetical protein